MHFDGAKKHLKNIATGDETLTSIYDTDLPCTLANYAPLTPLAFLQRAVEVYSMQLAVVYGELRQNWSEAYARRRQLASSLRRHGISKNNTVSVMLPNTPLMVEVHSGVPMARAVQWDSMQSIERSCR